MVAAFHCPGGPCGIRYSKTAGWSIRSEVVNYYGAHIGWGWQQKGNHKGFNVFTGDGYNWGYLSIGGSGTYYFGSKTMEHSVGLSVGNKYGTIGVGYQVEHDMDGNVVSHGAYGTGGVNKVGIAMEGSGLNQHIANLEQGKGWDGGPTQEQVQVAQQAGVDYFESTYNRVPNIYIVRTNADTLYESQYYVEGTNEVYIGSTLPDDTSTSATIAEGVLEYECVDHPTYGKSLLINDGGQVPVVDGCNPNIDSPNYGSPYATEIFIHTGFYYERGSAGCGTIAPSQYNNFMNNFNVGDRGNIYLENE